MFLYLKYNGQEEGQILGQNINILGLLVEILMELLLADANKGYIPIYFGLFSHRRTMEETE